MRIGIDLDDTICHTTEIVQKCLERYAKEEHLNPLDIMNDEELKDKFYNSYLEEVYKNVEVKGNVVSVLRRLKHRGNQLYIITARSDDFTKKKINVTQVTENWLEKNKIEVDAIITSAYGETKAQACKDFKIDLMIDDDPYNYRKINAVGKKCLLFDDRERYDMKNNYFTNWLDIEKYIERNH